MDLERILNLGEFEEPARQNMAPDAFAYFVGGASDESTLRANVEAFHRFVLRPRVLVDVSKVDPATTMLGQGVSMPVAFAPTALHKLAHPDGEIASALASGEAGALMCLSTMSSVSLEEVAAVSPGPLWFQLYVHKDRDVAKSLVRRAAAAGYSAIVVTADLPVPGYREREYRHDLTIPDEARPMNFGNAATEQDFNHYLVGLHDQSLSWHDLGWIRDAAGDVPLVVKGILTAEDALLAVDHGVEGIVVSNHGGRQLDRSPAAIDALEEVVAAVDGRAEVYMDGGVRRGADVLVALALGARAVFLGRPFLYALATAGEAGVARAFELIRAEVDNAMALLGTPAAADVVRAHVGRSPR